MHSRDDNRTELAQVVVEKRNLDYVKVGIFYLDGVLQGKNMARDNSFSALKNGFRFRDVVVGWVSDNELYDNVSITGCHTGYSYANTASFID